MSASTVENFPLNFESKAVLLSRSVRMKGKEVSSNSLGDHSIREKITSLPVGVDDKIIKKKKEDIPKGIQDAMSIL